MKNNLEFSKLDLSDKPNVLKVFIVSRKDATPICSVEEKVVVASSSSAAIDVSLQEHWGWEKFPDRGELQAFEVKCDSPRIVERYYRGE